LTSRPGVGQAARKSFGKPRQYGGSPGEQFQYEKEHTQTAFEAAMARVGLVGTAEEFGVDDGLWAKEGESLSRVFSAGVDGCFRIWDLESRLCVMTIDLAGPRKKLSGARYSPKTFSCIDVGPPLVSRGGSRGLWLIALGSHQGSVTIISFAGHEHVHEDINVGAGSGCVQDVKFSPSGAVLAVAIKTMVELFSITQYDTERQHSNGCLEGVSLTKIVIAPISTLIRHSCPVMRVDFTDDGCYIKSSDAGAEFAVWSVADPASPGYTVNTMRPDKFGEMKIFTSDLSAPPLDGAAVVTVSQATSQGGRKNVTFAEAGHKLCGERVTDDDVLRNLRYKSMTCPFGWSVRAIWRPRSDGRDIHSLAAADAGDVIAVAYSPKAIHIGKVTDPTQAKETSGLHYNLLARQCLGTSAVLNEFVEQQGFDHGRCVTSHGLIKDGLDSYRAVLVDFHTVKLLRFPCVGLQSAPFLRDSYMPGSSGVPGAGPSTVPAWYSATPKSYKGHSGSVGAIKFCCDDRWASLFEYLGERDHASLFAFFGRESSCMSIKHWLSTCQLVV
jgi:hypothetical protein